LIETRYDRHFYIKETGKHYKFGFPFLFPRLLDVKVFPSISTVVTYWHAEATNFTYYDRETVERKFVFI
jgi:hypothetical protein